MRILYISQYYPPEIGATQTRAYEMASNLVRMGHRVTVLTEFPNHPVGIIPREYKNRVFQRGWESGIEVIRMWVFTRPKKNFKTRMLFYLSFMFMTILRGVFLREKYDVVFATSPPLFVAVAGWIISFVKRTQFVMEVRDLWPELAVVLGQLSNRLFIILSEKLEQFLYHRATNIVVVTKWDYERLTSRGVLGEKLTLITNGANTYLYEPGMKDPSVLKELGLDDSAFIVAYTGLIGLIHGVEFVMEVAYELRTEKDIFFVFIGDGVRKSHLMDLARKYRLKNVIFLKSQSEARLPRYIQSCDGGLVTIKNIESGKGKIPVKMFTYMACAKPLLLCVDGEARRIVEDSGAGICIEPENGQQLREAILRLKENPELCQSMGKEGRRCVERHFSRVKLAEELERCLIRTSVENKTQRLNK